LAEWRTPPPNDRKATSWFQQGNYTKAAMAATKAVQAAEQTLGLNHPDVATGLVCYAREQFTKADHFINARLPSGKRLSAPIIQMWPKV
jgi:hypothetical protein